MPVRSTPHVPKCSGLGAAAGVVCGGCCASRPGARKRDRVASATAMCFRITKTSRDQPSYSKAVSGSAKRDERRACGDGRRLRLDIAVRVVVNRAERLTGNSDGVRQMIEEALDLVLRIHAARNDAGLSGLEGYGT